MRHESPVALVQAWQDAANGRDVERLVALSAPDIGVVGPRGSSRGHQVLRDWLGRAGLRLGTLRVFARGAVVVVAQHAVWHSAETGAVTGERTVASCFQTDDRRVARVARYDSLDVALAEAGLEYADETAPPGAIG